MVEGVESAIVAMGELPSGAALAWAYKITGQVRRQPPPGNAFKPRVNPVL
jgi:hypothetical protein